MALLEKVRDRVGRKVWTTMPPVGKNGLKAGLWLVDPDGRKVVRFMDDHAARHAAAALSLTTPKQRSEWLASQAGYVGRLGVD